MRTTLFGAAVANARANLQFEFGDDVQIVRAATASRYTAVGREYVRSRGLASTPVTRSVRDSGSLFGAQSSGTYRKVSCATGEPQSRGSSTKWIRGEARLRLFGVLMKLFDLASNAVTSLRKWAAAQFPKRGCSAALAG